MQGARGLVVVSFVSLTLGAAGGYWLGRESPAEPAAEAPHPVGAAEHARLGMTALGRGDAAEAERRFRSAAAIAPEDAALRADLAVALMVQRRWEEAEAELERAERLAPDMPEVLFLQGVVARDGLDDPGRATERWERFLDVVPPGSSQADSVRQWIADLRD